MATSDSPFRKLDLAPAASMFTAVLAGQNSSGRHRTWVGLIQSNFPGTGGIDEMWIARSAMGWSAIGTWKLMMIGLATPTIEPLSGLNVGGRNTGAPVNGVES